jgi:replicative DNA helicase
MNNLHSFNIIVKLKSQPASFEEIAKHTRIVDFVDPNHQAIYQSFCHYYDRNNHNLGYGFRESLRKESLAIWDSILVEPPPTPEQIKQNIKALKDETTRTLGLKCATDFINKVTTDPDNFSLYRSELFRMMPSSLQNKKAVRKGQEILESVLAQIDKRIKGEEEEKITTPFDSLNWLLNGGIGPGQLVVLSSRTNFGKSMFCSQLLLNWIHTDAKKVAIIGLEMSDEEYLCRVLAQSARIIGEKNLTLNNIYQPNKYFGINADFKNIFKEIMGSDIADRFIAVQEKIMSFEVLQEQCEMIVQAEKPDVIVIDHLLLLEKTGSEKEHELIHAVTKWAKAFAVENGVRVIAVSQINRDSDIARPKVTDMSGGRGIENQADLILGISKHLEEEESEPGNFGKKFLNEEDNYLRRINIMKNRHGIKDKYILTEFEGENAGFAEILPDNWQSLLEDPPEGKNLTWSQPYKKNIDYIISQGD